MKRVGCWLLAMVVLSTVSCGNSEERAPGVGDCTGVLCGNPGGGGSTTPTPEAGVDADPEQDAEQDAAVVELSGGVVRLVEETFTQAVPFEAWGYLRVPTATGDEQVDFGGDAGVGFSVAGVVPGDGWFTVVPDSVFLDGVMPTYAYLQVPEEGASDFEIPVVDRDVLTVLYASLAPPAVVRSDAAHVVVVFEKGGQRLSGVRVSSHPTAEAVAYDQGVGFAADATETGPNGVVLLVNVVGTGPLRWRVGDGADSTLTLVHVPGQASFVRVVVP